MANMEQMKEQAEANVDKKQAALAGKETEAANLKRDIKRYKLVANQVKKAPDDAKWFDQFNYDKALTDITKALEDKEKCQKEFEVSSNEHSLLISKWLSTFTRN